MHALGMLRSSFSRWDHGMGKDFDPWVPAALALWGLPEACAEMEVTLPHKGEISLSSLAEAGDKESSSSERA